MMRTGPIQAASGASQRPIEKPTSRVPASSKPRATIGLGARASALTFILLPPPWRIAEVGARAVAHMRIYGVRIHETGGVRQREGGNLISNVQIGQISARQGIWRSQQRGGWGTRHGRPTASS